ncbi:MAG: DivIVA domain-containing protein [Synergistaceae bacterium]|nr:DivIVA domain-containing protein [Synergistaceae bacterium]
MSELLTAKDVELKIFKKVSFGGYAISDVEEFLNQIAEDLETYVLRLNDQQRRVYELEEALKRHEAMKDTIKDALILAQQSAKDKEEEARHQAGLILAKAEAKLGEIDDAGRRRLEEAESTADDIVVAARTAAAQIIKSAEELREEAQRRLESAEQDISNHIAEANDKAGEITATARLEARRVTSKVKNEVEECKREMNTLVLERRRFLRDSEELVSAFAHMIEDAAKELRSYTERQQDSPAQQELSKSDTGRMTLSFLTDPSLDDEAAIS